MNRDLKKDFGANSLKVSAVDLAKQLGVSLASKAPAAAAGPAAPFALVRGLQQEGWLNEIACIASSSEQDAPPHCRYVLHFGKPAEGAAKPGYRQKDWMRQSMPMVADTMDWLRTWMPAELLPLMFVNLWAGRGYMVDEGAGLALGSPPRKDWLLLSRPDEHGVTTVQRRTS